MLSGALPSSARDAYGRYREVHVTAYCNLYFNERKSLSFNSHIVHIIECYRKYLLVKLSWIPRKNYAFREKSRLNEN